MKIIMTAVAMGFFLIYAVGCAPAAVDIPTLPTPFSYLSVYTSTPTITMTPTVTATIAPTATPNRVITLTPTPQPFRDLYIASLMDRNYGGGVLEDAGNLNSTEGFTRKLFRYRSDGLDLYGFINIPAGEGPFPVIVLVHGYIDPAEFSTLDYSVRYADALVKAGYITIHPNLRGYGPSDSGKNVLGTGDAIDVLNLVGLVRQQAGSEGLLKTADAERIGMWGHSMGGAVVMRALIVDKDIRAGLLYASINVDEAINLVHFEKDGRGNEKTEAMPETLKLLSPINYLKQITVPIGIFHGGEDEVVPARWSRELCTALEEMGKTVVCREYPDQPHTFQNEGDTQFIREMIAFFDTNIR
jgi:uncharacterized protein